MIVLISEDLMMSSTVSSAVRLIDGTFRYVKSVERALAKLDGNECEFLFVDLQTPELDWVALESLVESVPRAIGYAQHVNVDVLKKGRELPFEAVLTRGQFHAGVAELITG
jgi:hypothetical protein